MSKNCRKTPILKSRVSKPASGEEQIGQSILVIRGQKVLLDEQLAGFYGVETKALVRAMKRNIERFPADFMFQLDPAEWESLRYQIGTINLRYQIGTSS